MKKLLLLLYVLLCIFISDESYIQTEDIATIPSLSSVLVGVLMAELKKLPCVYGEHFFSQFRITSLGIRVDRTEM